MTKYIFDSSTSISTPVGIINLYALGEKLVNVEYGETAAETSGKSQVIKTAKKQLEKYFAGSRAAFLGDIKLEGTEFQIAVWQTIAKIPFGETMTYGQIAQAVNKPAAVRAVGGAVGANPLPLIIGCHRVLGSNSKITGYTGGKGIETKQWLLEHEKIEYRS